MKEEDIRKNVGEEGWPRCDMWQVLDLEVKKGISASHVYV